MRPTAEHHQESLGDILTNDWGLTIRFALVGIVVGLFFLVATSLLVSLFVPSAGLSVALLLGVGLSIALIAVIYYRSLKKATTGEDISEYPFKKDPDFDRRVEELAHRMGIPRPHVMRKEMGEMNAYAIGRASNGYVVLSDRLIDEMSQKELEAVVAHEMAHIKHRGSIVSTIAITARKTIKYAVMILAGIYVLLLALWRYSRYRFFDQIHLAILSLTRGWSGKIINHIASVVTSFVLLFEMTLSRYREYLADHRAAMVLGSHRPMVSALDTLDKGADQVKTNDERKPVPSSMCIFGKEESLLGRLFATHPPIENRMNRLEREFDGSRSRRRKQSRNTQSRERSKHRGQDRTNDKRTTEQVRSRNERKKGRNQRQTRDRNRNSGGEKRPQHRDHHPNSRASGEPAPEDGHDRM